MTYNIHDFSAPKSRPSDYFQLTLNAQNNQIHHTAVIIHVEDRYHFYRKRMQKIQINQL